MVQHSCDEGLGDVGQTLPGPLGVGPHPIERLAHGDSPVSRCGRHHPAGTRSGARDRRPLVQAPGTRRLERYEDEAGSPCGCPAGIAAPRLRHRTRPDRRLRSGLPQRLRPSQRLPTEQLGSGTHARRPDILNVSAAVQRPRRFDAPFGCRGPNRPALISRLLPGRGNHRLLAPRGWLHAESLEDFRGPHQGGCRPTVRGQMLRCPSHIHRPAPSSVSWPFGQHSRTGRADFPPG